MKKEGNKNEKNAVLKMDLKSSSGLRLKAEAKISANQWENICRIIYRPDLPLQVPNSKEHKEDLSRTPSDQNTLLEAIEALNETLRGQLNIDFLGDDYFIYGTEKQIKELYELLSNSINCEIGNHVKNEEPFLTFKKRYKEVILDGYNLGNYINKNLNS